MSFDCGTSKQIVHWNRSIAQESRSISFEGVFVDVAFNTDIRREYKTPTKTNKRNHKHQIYISSAFTTTITTKNLITCIILWYQLTEYIDIAKKNELDTQLHRVHMDHALCHLTETETTPCVKTQANIITHEPMVLHFAEWSITTTVVAIGDTAPESIFNRITDDHRPKMDLTSPGVMVNNNGLRSLQRISSYADQQLAVDASQPVASGKRKLSVMHASDKTNVFIKRPLRTDGNCTSGGAQVGSMDYSSDAQLAFNASLRSYRDQHTEPTSPESMHHDIDTDIEYDTSFKIDFSDDDNFDTEIDLDIDLLAELDIYTRTEFSFGCIHKDHREQESL